MSEGFDNYGLRVKIIADYQYDEGRRVGRFNQTTLDPGTDDILKMVIALVEGCYDWGVSRKDLIDSLKNSLDEIYQEHVGPVYSLPETEGRNAGRYKTPDEYAEFDPDDPLVFRSTP